MFSVRAPILWQEWFVYTSFADGSLHHYFLRKLFFFLEPNIPRNFLKRTHCIKSLVFWCVVPIVRKTARIIHHDLLHTGCSHLISRQLSQPLSCFYCPSVTSGACFRFMYTSLAFEIFCSHVCLKKFSIPLPISWLTHLYCSLLSGPASSLINRSILQFIFLSHVFSRLKICQRLQLSSKHENRSCEVRP